MGFQHKQPDAAGARAKNNHADNGNTAVGQLAGTRPGWRGGVAVVSMGVHLGTKARERKRPMTRKGLSISLTPTQLSNLSLPATKLNCYVFQGRAEDRGRNHWAQF